MKREPIDNKDLGNQLQAIESAPLILLMDWQQIKISYQPFLSVIKAKRKYQEKHYLERNLKKSEGR